MAVSTNSGSILCGCPDKKSATILGLVLGPLTFGNSQIDRQIDR